MKTQRDTPKWLAKRIHDIARSIILKPSPNILEPSAGSGVLADEFITFNGIPDITCVELNAEKCQILREMDGFRVIHGDFMDILKYQYKTDFDLIVAAPPFKGNVDVKHIMRMHDLLTAEGAIVTLTSPLWMVNNEQHQVEFREFLTNKRHSISMLPDNTFIEKGKTVPTAILTLFR